MIEILRAEGVFKSKTDSRKGVKKKILKGIDLSLGAGEVWTLIGPSGGGKTTLIRLFNRLEEPSAGRLLFRGRELGELNPLELRRRVVLIQQKSFMFAGTVLDNLQRPFALAGEPLPPESDSRLLWAADLCCLPAALFPEEARALSAGQQQRVQIARGLLCGPELLILDEGTSALDRPTAEGLAANLRRWCRERGTTLFMVSHDLALMEKAADKGLYLEDGVIQEEGVLPAFFKAPASPRLARFLAEIPPHRE